MNNPHENQGQQPNQGGYPQYPQSGPQPQQQPGPYGPQQGQPQQPYGAPSPYGQQPGFGAMPNNNLGWGIGAILLCWPFAIPSLIKATSVQSLWAQGQAQEAHQAAGEAKKWGKIGIIVGACGYGLIILLYVVMILIGLGLASAGV